RELSVRVQVREGLFTDGDTPALLGTRCSACGSVHFPRADACTYCATPDPEPIALSQRGTLWAWTAVTAPPPGYEGEVPFGVGVVELPEGVRVITRLTESDPAALAQGQPMELRIVPLHRDHDGNDVVTYAFAPA
ncbi:MAG TPA: Zn-ribbon domain-containing OB-fold protein, partial [Acidimicrobiales bacterium]